jgi:hypothetical protein
MGGCSRACAGDAPPGRFALVTIPERMLGDTARFGVATVVEPRPSEAPARAGGSRRKAGSSEREAFARRWSASRCVRTPCVGQRVRASHRWFSLVSGSRPYRLDIQLDAAGISTEYPRENSCLRALTEASAGRYELCLTVTGAKATSARLSGLVHSCSSQVA